MILICRLLILIVFSVFEHGGLLYFYSENPISHVKVSEGLKITRPSSNSEAVTMYKLKGQSSTMRTGQSFKKNGPQGAVVRASPSYDIA